MSTSPAELKQKFEDWEQMNVDCFIEQYGHINDSIHANNARLASPENLNAEEVIDIQLETEEKQQELEEGLAKFMHTLSFCRRVLKATSETSISAVVKGYVAAVTYGTTPECNVNNQVKTMHLCAASQKLSRSDYIVFNGQMLLRVTKRSIPIRGLFNAIAQVFNVCMHRFSL